MSTLFSPAQHQQLMQYLSREIDATSDMLQALKVEADALTQHRADKLDQAVQIKQEKLQLLDQAGKKREQLVKQLFTDKVKTELTLASRAEAEDIDLFKQDKSLNIMWNRLLTLAQQCQQQNHINGVLVERSYQQSRHALDILQGLATEAGLYTATDSSKPEEYNHFGQTTCPQRSRRIAQA